MMKKLVAVLALLLALAGCGEVDESGALAEASDPAPSEPMTEEEEEPEPESDFAAFVDSTDLGAIDDCDELVELSDQAHDLADDSGGDAEALLDFEQQVLNRMDEVCEEEEPEPEPEPVAKFSKDDYEDVDQREFSKIARDPDGHMGRQLLVFGEVMQFDSFTGTDAFRASVDGDRQTGEYVFYDHNAFLMGDDEMLEDVVTDDRFRAYATVLGALEYDTTMGGTQNALLLSIDRISVID